jgi:ribosomal protein S18 acetylase RimI-like enzyme
MVALPDAIAIRRATPADVAAIAVLFARVRTVKLPYLPKLHSPEEDVRFFGDHVMSTCTVWVAESDILLGFIAFRTGWVDHLYADLGHENRGIGSALLGKAMAAGRSLTLWAFQRNTAAIDFYRRKGFAIVKETDGSKNEEQEPDVLLARTKDDQSLPL